MKNKTRSVEEILEAHKNWLDGNSGAKLVWCKLSEDEKANLRSADLSNANLLNADLRNANLCNADLRYANGYHSVCPEIGSFIAFKKLRDNKIAKLEIPEHAKRSSATSRKCRASEAKVLEIFNASNHDKKFEIGYSCHENDFEYRVGTSVCPDSFDEDRFNECSNGIHFFITLQEAIDY